MSEANYEKYEKDYDKKTKHLVSTIIDIINKIEKDSHNYGTEIQTAFKEALNVYHVREKVEGKYDEIKSKSDLTPSEKFEELVKYFQTELDLAKMLFGLAGRFGQDEYVKKYGSNSAKFSTKMRAKYDKKIENAIIDMNQEMAHLLSLREKSMRDKVKSMEKKIYLLASNILKDASPYGDNAKVYFKKLIESTYRQDLEERVHGVLEMRGSFQRNKFNVCEALKLVKTEALDGIRKYIQLLVPSKMVGKGSTPLVKCRDMLFKKYSPIIKNLQFECDKLIEEYS